MKSYMNDYHDTFVSGKDSARGTYRAGFVAGGLALFGMGVLTSAITPIAGIPAMALGIGSAVYAWIYYRPIK